MPSPRRPDGTWAGYPDNGTGGGQIPGCGPTRAQVVASQGDSHVGLLPMSVDRQSVMVVRLRGKCGGCDNLRAIGAAGHILPANYGPEQYRNH